MYSHDNGFAYTTSSGGGIHPQLVTFSVLTETEKKRPRERAQELFKFLQLNGFRIIAGITEPNKQGRGAGRHDDGGVGGSAMEKRFAYSLLEKLLEYVDKAAYNMKNTRPATRSV